MKGFGAKTEKAILDGIEIAATAGQRMYWAEADQIAQALREHLRSCASIEQLELAGSYRRGRDTVGDLDILVVAGESAEVMDRFGGFPGVADVLGRGDTKMSVRLSSGLQVDLRVVPRESFGAALQYFTGSKDHNVVLRGLAKQRGLKINEYGVFRVEGERETYIAGAAEEDVYATLGPAVLPAGAARGAARVRVGRGGRPAGAGRPGRHPRRPARAHAGDGRPRHARRDGRSRPATRPEVHRHHRPFAARDHGPRAWIPNGCWPSGNRSTG